MIQSSVTVSLVPEARGGPFVFWDDLPGACGTAGKLGFDGIEIFPPSAIEVPEAELRSLLDAHGLKLAAATFLGTFAIMLLGFLALVPVALLLVALAFVVPLVAVIVLGCLLLLPAFGVLTAIAGTVRSSVWTVGYVTQVDA